MNVTKRCMEVPSDRHKLGLRLVSNARNRNDEQKA
jgi:hypothetical protein